MHGSLDLIFLVASGLTGALIFGYITHRLGLSPIVGYLLAGVMIGPHTPGYRGDVHLAHQLAEIGVILLMFGVGLHFHLKDLLSVKDVAIPGAIGQSIVATVVAIAVFSLFGMPWQTGAVIGMAMAVASTVVLMRVLMDADMLNSSQGHVAVGWLIVEDIFTVVLLVLIPVLGTAPVEPGGHDAHAAVETAGSLGFGMVLGLALLKLAALVVIVLLAGSRVIPKVMVHVARLRSRELFTLTVLVISIAIAAGSYVFFGASMALGAFLAGMVVAQSPVSHQAAADALPMRDAFAVLFFVSVGMLFDPSFLITHPLMVVAAMGIVLLAKPLAALVIVALLGHSARTALTVAIGLAQVGEFSFILSDLAGRHGLMPTEGHNMLVAAAILSITLNPLLFRALPKIERWLKARPRLWKILNGRAERRAMASNEAIADQFAKANNPKERLAIVVGYGPVGRSVHRLLREAKLATVIIDMNMDTVSSLKAAGQPAIFGDASHDTILEQAGMRHASHLILTLPHTTDRAAVVAAARSLNPNVRILVRARYIRERRDLEQAGANAAVFEEVEAAIALARLVLADTGLHREAADRKIKDLRLQLIMENVSNIRSQRVRSVMVPWSRVRWLSSSADRDAVLAQVSQERFSRWPVVDPATRRPIGYLLTKDLIARAAAGDWLALVRPLKSIHSENTIESVLMRMQDEADSVYLVEDGEQLIGMVTHEDILEQVVGQIEDEYPHEHQVSLIDAVSNGAIVLELAARTGAEAIAELARAIPSGKLPPEISGEQIGLLAQAREEQVSTVLGNGVAIPNVPCPGLAVPLVIFGRCHDGILFSPGAAELVHLAFLLVTPAEQPETQLALLKQLADICCNESSRDALMQADSPTDVLSLIDTFAFEPRPSP
ncbi:MAG: cation:proton antiporter [Planctomycetaceae bacterium]|nr:cation:proton antiporter [Planctomycetaceae bacterium]